MIDLRRPLDLAGVALALALALLGGLQLQRSAAFSSRAVATTATIVELETPKRGLLDAESDTIATIEFDVEGERQTATLAEPLAVTGLEPNGALGAKISIRYDPAHPSRAHYGTATGRPAALALFALALGALFAPMLLRRAQMASGSG